MVKSFRVGWWEGGPGDFSVSPCPWVLTFDFWLGLDNLSDLATQDHKRAKITFGGLSWGDIVLSVLYVLRQEISYRKGLKTPSGFLYFFYFWDALKGFFSLFKIHWDMLYLYYTFLKKNHFALFVLSVCLCCMYYMYWSPMQALLQQEVSDSHIYIITVACIAHD